MPCATNMQCAATSSSNCRPASLAPTMGILACSFAGYDRILRMRLMMFRRYWMLTGIAALRRNAWPISLLCGTAAFTCFAVAASCWPGGGYNPFMQMLSSLGRTVVKGVVFPLCRYLFMVGMGFASMGVAVAFWNTHSCLSGWRRHCGKVQNQMGLRGNGE